MKRLAFALAAIALSFGATTAVFFAADVYAHHRFDEAAGLNWRGYRGAVVGRKARNEFRVVVLGGSTALGYGLHWSDAFPAQLERRLKAKSSRPISVVNLGYNNEGAYSMRFTLDDYRRLDPDLAILYEGYNDVNGATQNTQVFRHGSAVFRLTGYYPILPVVLTEKLMALRAGGDLGAAYRGDQVVFRPTFRQRMSIGVLNGADRLSSAAARQLERLAPDESKKTAAADADGKISMYCDDIEQAVKLARSRGTIVIVVTQPYMAGGLHGRHIQQQAALARRLTATFSRDPGVRYLNLGDSIDLHDRSLAWDGMHLTPEGNAIIAASLEGPVSQYAQDVTTVGAR
jgi:lysophospholipase L1-like esterase